MDDVLRAVRGVLATTPARWTSLSQHVAGARLHRAPAPGEWAAITCLRHLLDTEREVFPTRVRAFLADEDFPAFDPATEGSLNEAPPSMEALVAEFVRRRADSLAQLDTLAPTDLARQAHHGELGTVTLGELLHEWAGHDLMHTIQAEQALMQPFIEGCGPWQRYFAEHRA